MENVENMENIRNMEKVIFKMSFVEQYEQYITKCVISDNVFNCYVVNASQNIFDKLSNFIFSMSKTTRKQLASYCLSNLQTFHVIQNNTKTNDVYPPSIHILNIYNWCKDRSPEVWKERIEECNKLYEQHLKSMTHYLNEKKLAEAKYKKLIDLNN